MLKVERQEGILRILHEKQHASMDLLAKELFVSPATVRRDVLEMEASGLVKRRYGGVSLAEGGARQTESLDLRIRENREIKKKLARRAAALVHDGDTVLLDSSSTVLEMVPFLAEHKNITVVTNSLRTAEALQKARISVYCTGGFCGEDAATLSGSIAETSLRSFNTDLFFFSSRGISDRGMVSDSSDSSTQIRRVMMRQAQRSVLLCDSSKLGKKYLFSLCHVSDIDTVLCDQPLPESCFE